MECGQKNRNPQNISFPHVFMGNLYICIDRETTIWIESGKKHIIAKGMRQRCLIFSYLFNLYVKYVLREADDEHEF